MSALTIAPADDDLPERETEKVTKKARSTYDLSILEKNSPKLIRLVAWLITIPGMSWHAIAKQAGMAWETVAAIAKRSYDVREWRNKTADMVALVLEASGPGLLKRASEGKLNPFEFKQLVDAWTQLSAQATVRSEHTININVTGPEADLMRMIDSTSSRLSLLRNDREAITVDVQGMGSHTEKTAALPVLADASPSPDDIGISEESPPKSGSDV